jgi:glycosyltransferase involved in cell wall biosynthesis
MKKVTVVIPCYNEETGIAAVIQNLPSQKLTKLGYALDVLVVDNNSKDRTAEVAREAGARVVHEPKQGKGNAIKTGFYNITPDTDFVVMLDGDDTYKAHEIARLLEPLDSDFADVIIGSRLGGKMKHGSMKGFNRLGNWFFSFMVRVLYRVNVTDVLTGYFAWKRETIEKLRPHLRSSGFAIEMEMITKMARLGYQIYSVPISYEPRLGESSLRPVYDGSRILRALLRNRRWSPIRERMAFVSDAVYPYNFGGKEKRLHEISKRLVKDGRDVTIYTMKWWDGPNEIVQDGVKLHAISRKYDMYAGDRRSIKQAVLFGLACSKLLFRRFDLVDVDHMPVFPLMTMRAICTLRRKKLYATWHEVWGADYWRQYMGSLGSLAAFLEWLSFRLPDRIISNSEHTSRLLKEAGVKTERIRTVPLGVDLDLIFNAPKASQTSDVIYVGRLLEHKNVDVLIKAVAKVKKIKADVSCIIVGDGPERKNLETLARKLKLLDNITFYNFVDDHIELYGLMKSSRTLVLPSVREGFGLVVVEANACGLPVITTKHQHNAAKDLIVEGQNGLLANATPAGIAEQLLQLLDLGADSNDLDVRQGIGRYHWNNVATEIERVFNEA